MGSTGEGGGGRSATVPEGPAGGLSGVLGIPLPKG